MTTDISIHALREEGDRRCSKQSSNSSNFYPRPPRGGRPADGLLLLRAEEISIHALREEGDRCTRWSSSGYWISIHALREEGDKKTSYYINWWRISIHALREEGDVRNARPGVLSWISIHALREEGDLTKRNGEMKSLSISIHALREEGDVTVPFQQADAELFLSTPSARRATASGVAVVSGIGYFYPRPPRGGRLAGP